MTDRFDALFQKHPKQTYTDHATTLMLDMQFEDEDGKPTWEYDLIAALVTAHSDVVAVQVLRDFADRVEREVSAMLKGVRK